MNTFATRALASVVSISLALSPSLSFARDVAAPKLPTSAVRAPMAPLAIPALPALTGLDARIPTIGVNAAIPTAHAARTAPVSASLQAQGAAVVPSLTNAQAPTGAVKSESARAFEGLAAHRAAEIEPAAYVVSNAASSVRPLAASSAKAPSAAKSVPSPRSIWAARARKYLPAAGVAAAAAIFAQVTGQAEAAFGALGMMPLMMGSTRGDDAAKRAEFLRSFRDKTAPGESVGVQFVAELADEAGVDRDEAFRLIEAERAEGRAAVFTNGLVMRLELDASAETDGQAKLAISTALESIKSLDKPLPEALAALGKLALARDRAAMSGSENVASIERQLHTLRVNAGFDLLRRLVSEKRVQPETAEYAAGLAHDVVGGSVPLAPTNVAIELNQIAQSLPGFNDENAQRGRGYLKNLVGFVSPQAVRANFAGPQGQPTTVDGVHQYLRKRLIGGFEVSSDVKSDIAEELQVKTAEVELALRQLAADNRLVRVGKGELIYSGLWEVSRTAPADQSDPKRMAVNAALAGLKYLNGGSLLEHSLAEAALSEALGHLQGGTTAAPWGDVAEEVSILRANAVQKIAGDVLALYVKQLDDSRPADKRMAEQWQRWLNASFASHDRKPQAITVEMRKWLVELFDEIVPSQKALQSRAHAKHIAEAVAEAGKYVASLKAEDPKLLPAPGKKPGAASLIAKNDSNYKALNQFGTNLTQLAADGALKPLIGRRKEIRQAIKVLMRSEGKNNPIVAGEPGVGKTAIVEGLAQLLVDGSLPEEDGVPEMTLPEEMKGKNIFRLNVQALVAGTTLRGQFEERLENVLKEVLASNGKVVLFIDEVHMLLGLGSAEGAQDAAETLLQYMARPGFSLIGATTLDMYRKIEKKGALNRRFGLVKAEPPTPAEAIKILLAAKTRMEQKHNLSIPDDTVKAAVHLATKFVADRFLPDSALDLLDDAATEVRLKASEAKAAGQPVSRTVTKDDIGFEIAVRMDVPTASMTGDEREKLKTMPERLSARVIGQEDAVAAVTKAVRRSKLGYKDPKQPDMFVFLGPTGVGKTELVKALALDQFGDETAMTRLDMSEFAEKHSVSRLTGAPPGYVGYEEGGKLTEAVRRKPYQILLLDEIDKAHPDVWNLLLQIKDDGRLTDGEGRTIDFKNVIIIATANYKGQHSQDAGREEKKRNPIGFSLPKAETPEAPKGKTPEEKEARKKQYVEDFRDAVRPEMFNRIGERNVVAFNELESAHYAQIAGLREAELNKRLAHKNMTIKLTEGAVKQLLADADTPENRRYGARPLKQTVEDEVVESLVEADLEGTIAEGDDVVVDYDAVAKAWVAKKLPKTDS